MYLLCKRLLGRRDTPSASDKPPPVYFVDSKNRQMKLVPLLPDMYELTHVPIELQKKLNRHIATSLSHPSNARLRSHLNLPPHSKVFASQISSMEPVIYVVQFNRGASIKPATQLQVRYAIRLTDTGYAPRRPYTGIRIVVNHVLSPPRRT